MTARSSTDLTHCGVDSATETVVASYHARTRFARAETAIVPRPRLLRGLLAEATRVAEIPCGTGHFLTDYVHANSSVTLVDASPAMLAMAREYARGAGLPPQRTHALQCYVQDLPLLDPVDLVVVPNAALNQLADQMPLAVLLARLRAGLRPGGQLLAQVSCTHPGGGVDHATFYDPGRPHGVWFADRWFDPAPTGGAVLRRRRQHRAGDRLRIEFDYHDPAGTSLHTTAVDLVLFSADTLAAALTAAGLAHVRFLPGQGGLSEVLAAVEGTRP